MSEHASYSLGYQRGFRDGRHGVIPFSYDDSDDIDTSDLAE